MCSKLPSGLHIIVHLSIQSLELFNQYCPLLHTDVYFFSKYNSPPPHQVLGVLLLGII